MPTHRGETRREDARPGTDRIVSPSDEAGQRVTLDDDLAYSVEALPTPAGSGGEFSTSLQTPQEAIEYTVPPETVGRLREISLSLEANGEAKIEVAGSTYGPFTGAVDYTVPLDDAVLPPGYQVRVFHQSTDGTTTTTKAAVVVLEV
jgi:hypothetical protein